MTSPGHIEFNEVAAPGELKPNEVLLKIQRIGVCGSDIHVFHGNTLQHITRWCRATNTRQLLKLWEWA